MIPHDLVVPTPEQMCKKVLWNHKEINAALFELARKVWIYYQEKKIYHLHTVTVLEGASRTRDGLLHYIQLLNRHKEKINPPLVCHEDSVMISSYKDGFISSRKPKIIMPPKFSTFEHQVLIIEDIIDTGTAMSYLLNNLNHFTTKPRDLQILTLINKPNNRTPKTMEIIPNFVGFELLENHFVVGYGLDYKHYYRNLPYIMAIKDEYRK